LTNRTQRITTLALLAALNCVFETSLGNSLHALHFPFSGMVLISLNVLIYVFARWVRPQPGSILAVALVTVVGNLAAGGAFKLPALLAILLEGLLVELVVDLLGFRKFAYQTAAAAAFLFSLFYPLLSARIFMTGEVANRIWTWIMHLLSTFPAGMGMALVATLVTILVYASLGWIAGSAAWRIFRWAERSLNARTVTSD